jgi:hypothetical protein
MPQLRARDVRDRCKGRVDPNVQYCIEALAEQQYQLDKGLVAVAALVDQMSDIIKNFVAVAENMKKAVDVAKQHGIPDDEGGAVS